MGLFISMEGSDGCGKTTQMNLLQEALLARGYALTRSREPGGTRISEKLRELVLDPENREMDERCEALLYAASRAQHVREVIRPALERGEIMLCDRFIDSSVVYQGIGRGLGIREIAELNGWAVSGLMPDLTLILYIDYEEGLRRKKLQTEDHLDRLEQAAEDFHRRVNEGYKTLAELYPERIVLIDACGSIAEVHKAVLDTVERFLAQHPDLKSASL